MTSGLRFRLAHALGRHVARVMPPSRSDWARAMQAEIEAVNDPVAALIFALGCVRASYMRQLRTVTGVLTAARMAVAIAAAIFSIPVLATAHAFGALANPEILPQVTTGLGLAFLTAGLSLLIRGPAALIGIATTMLMANTLGLLANSRMALLQGHIYQALILEGYLLWSLLLLTGLALHICGRSIHLARFAERHGWAD